MNSRIPEIIKVRAFSDEIDDYGFKRKEAYEDRPIEAVVAIYSQKPVQDIRYNDCELIAITNDDNITDENEIIINDEAYQILHVIPSARKFQLLLKKK